jgi:hypothetical protein
MEAAPYGFRLVGCLEGRRRLVNAAAAFSGYAACEPAARVECEAYLSAFTFGAGFRRLLEGTGSPRGYAGPCAADWLWWDVDRPGDAERALGDARRLAAAILERFRTPDEDDLLVFFSGGKGYHLGLPTCLWRPDPSMVFNAAARRFAERLAGRVRVAIDQGVYDKVRPFRAPNSRHPRTGLFKRRLRFDELMGLTAVRIRELAVAPEPFDIPAPAACDQATTDWREAVEAAERAAVERARGRTLATDRGRLSRATLEFIRAGADEGERALRLFRAAANLAEFGCPDDLAHALLSEAALDSGLTPSETRRQIDCGLRHAARESPTPNHAGGTP